MPWSGAATRRPGSRTAAPSRSITPSAYGFSCPIEPCLLHADAAIRRIVVGPVLVIADPALGLVLQRARGAGDTLLGGNLFAVGDLAEACVCAVPGLNR